MGDAKPEHCPFTVNLFYALETENWASAVTETKTENSTDTESKLKIISFSREDLITAFEAIGKAIEVGEANYGTEGSNRVEEDWRIIQKVFAARALIEDVQVQLIPWANAFGFNARDPEEVKLSWSLTVGKATGICQELMRELSPGWQSRGRIGFNNPNTIEALLEAIQQINTADLNRALAPEKPPEEDAAVEADANPATPAPPPGKPTPKDLLQPVTKASQRPRSQPLRKAEPIKK